MEFGYSIAGFFVGAIVGLTGVGGGSLMTPLLVLLFGIHPAVAVGTDLLYAALTKAGGAVVHGRNGAVDWRIVLELGAGSVPAAALTLWWLSTHSDSTYGSQHLISGTLGIALLLTACALLFRKRLQAIAERPGISEWRERHLRSLTVGTGVVLGALVTISSVGAGRSAPQHWCFYTRVCRPFALWAVTSPMRCRSRWWPDWVTGGWAMSTGRCSAPCSSARSRASHWAARSRQDCRSVSCGRCWPPCCSGSAEN
jgi:hypothetical protein